MFGFLVASAFAQIAPISTPKQSAPITVVAVGDMMIGSDYPDVRLPPDDGKQSFAAVKHALDGDVVFGNLEGVLIDGGVSQKCQYTTGRCYAFRIPTAYAIVFKDAGFDVLSTANNHANDFGEDGRKSTANALDGAGIYHAGALNPCTQFVKNGIKYGFCAFSPNVAMVSINDKAQTTALVKALAPKVDVMMVSFHGGAEGATNTRVPRQHELYVGEDRGDVYDFAHSMIDAGADVVLGHGPHVTRAVELYRGKFIAYSLGNFNTYGRFNLSGVQGIAPILHLKLTPAGDFVSAKVISTKQTVADGLQLDPSGAAFLELKKLTVADGFADNLVFGNHSIDKK